MVSAIDVLQPAAPIAVRRERVLLVEPNDDGTVGGSHQVLLDFARHLADTPYEPVVCFNQHNVFVERLRDAGVEVHVIEATWQRERAVLRSGSRPRQARMLVSAIAERVRFLRQHDIALLHVNGTPQTAQDDWLPAARLARIPAIATCAGNIRGDVRSRVQRYLMRAFDRVLPVSAHIAAQVIAFGYAPRRVTTIPPGIDVDAFRARVRHGRASVRRRLAIPEEVLLVTMAGNIRRWKGQHVALAALPLLDPARRARVHLAFAGATSPADAAYERELHAYVDRHHLHATVSFLGRRDEVPDLMAASDVVLHASTLPEPFGLVVLEGMSLGCAVIASSLGAPPEIIAREAGLTFSPEHPSELAAHLELLLGSPARRDAMGAAGRRRAEAFSIARTVTATRRIYDELLHVPR